MGGADVALPAHPRRRTRMMFIVILFVFSLFVAQLLRLQGLDSASVAADAAAGRSTTSAIPAERGRILDASGAVMAESMDRRDVTADPVAMAEYRKRVDGERQTVGIKGAAEDIAEVLGRDPAPLQKRLEETKGRFTYLVRDISPQQWRAVRALRIPGVFFEATQKRSYPSNFQAAALVGWTTNDGVGASGAEQLYDSVLRGKPGSRRFEVGASGQVLPGGDELITPAQPGKDVQLTIDSDLQWYTGNLLAQRVSDTNSLSGSAVVVDAKTGEIMAAAEYPSFDPEKRSQTPDALQHEAFVEAFEPGSSAKVVSVAAAMEEGLVKADTPVEVPARLPRAGRKFRDSKNHGGLDLTVAGVIARSSNMGTIQVGEKMSPQVTYDYMRKFGLGQGTGINFPGETGGILAKPADWDAAQRYTVLYGQGMSATALQQASVFQTIANKGVRQPLSLLKAEGDDNNLLQPVEKTTPERVVSEDVAQSMSQMLEHVTTKAGTAPQAAIDGYRVAGKTSTASRYDADKGKYDGYTASFVGYAPAEDPRFVISVSLQRPKVGGIYGGVQAGPVFHDLMQYALQKYDVPPSRGDLPDIPLTFDRSAPAPGQPSGTTLHDVAIREGKENE